MLKLDIKIVCNNIMIINDCVCFAIKKLIKMYFHVASFLYQIDFMSFSHDSGIVMTDICDVSTVMTECYEFL